MFWTSLPVYNGICPQTIPDHFTLPTGPKINHMSFLLFPETLINFISIFKKIYQFLIKVKGTVSDLHYSKISDR